jgi:hypothetical protein
VLRSAAGSLDKIDLQRPRPLLLLACNAEQNVCVSFVLTPCRLFHKAAGVAGLVWSHVLRTALWHAWRGGTWAALQAHSLG